MKRPLIVLFVLAMALHAAFAGDAGLAFEDARFHSDLLGGLAPVYIRAGVDYSGLSLVENQRTNLIAVAGGALISSDIWTDLNGLPINGASGTSVDTATEAFRDANSYSKWEGDLSLKLKQGFIHEAGREKPFLAAYAKYAFHWTAPHENYGDGTYSTFLSGIASAYPDNAGTATNSLQAGVEIDRLDHSDTYNGYNVDASILWAPQWLMNTVRGTSDFVALNLTVKGFYRLLELNRENSDLTLIGIYLADRVRIDYLDGSAIPQFFQEGPALGSKMRGFEGNSLGSAFTAVNNFDIRIYGIEFLDNVNPVLQLFLDTGYRAGAYYNTGYAPEGQFFCSTGFEIAVNVFDFAQVGYMFGFPLVGSNIQEQAMQSGLIFQYKF